MIKLYIHTYGRAAVQKTLQTIPAALQKHLTLVVQHREAHLYKGWSGVDLMVLPSAIQTLSPTRQYILEHHNIKKHGPNLVLLDDDLRFAVRRKDDRTKFSPATDKDVLQMFLRLEGVLKKYAHAGVMGREGANRKTEDQIVGRMCRILAYDVPTYRTMKIQFDRVSTMQDFDATLQLLRAGYPNIILADWVHDQFGGSGSAGGCSAYRTLELQAANAHKLAELHKPFVKVVQKTTKSAWGGGTRTDVQIQWKKAYEHGKRI